MICYFLICSPDTLYFNRTASKFHWNLNAIDPDRALKKYEDAPVTGTINMPTEVYYGRRINLFDTTQDSLFSLVGMPNINKLLYVKEKAPEINWTIEDSTKNIGNYTVQKATAHFRGRHYTAWFTPKIPVPFGPWKLNGLPGLILQAYDNSRNIYFSATQINTISKTKVIETIQLDGNEQVVALPEYKKSYSNFDNYQKQYLLKTVRPHLSEKELAKITFEVKEVNHMEIFEKDKQ
ncbi:MAG: GLPGLI family protein [Fodinibius sp.]|nr:GLPGLI family protein [Fodinibius sp.]